MASLSTQLSRTLLVVSNGIMLMAVPGAGCSEATPAPGGQPGGAGGASGQLGTPGMATGGNPIAGSGGMGGKGNGGAGGALAPSAGSGGTSAGSGGTSAGSGGTSAGNGGTSAGSGGSAGSPPEPQPCTAIMPFVSPTIYEFPEPQAGGTGGAGGAGGAATPTVARVRFSALVQQFAQPEDLLLGCDACVFGIARSALGKGEGSHVKRRSDLPRLMR